MATIATTRAGPGLRKEASTLIQMTKIRVILGLTLGVACASPAFAADAEPRGAATQQVESGAKKVGEGITETASGVGNVAVEGATVAVKTVTGAARRSARIMGRAGKAAGEGAKTAAETVRDRLVDFGDDVVKFLKRPF
jgi:hypothetical protein